MGITVHRRFECPGLHGRPLVCELRHVAMADGSHLVMVSEVPGNPGASVTNAAEQIATWAAFRLELPPEDVMWVEHYPPDGITESVIQMCRRAGREAPRRSRHTFDHIEFSLRRRRGPAWFPPCGWHYSDPNWKPLDLQRHPSISLLAQDPRGGITDEQA